MGNGKCARTRLVNRNYTPTGQSTTVDKAAATPSCAPLRFGFPIGSRLKLGKQKSQTKTKLI